MPANNNFAEKVAFLWKSADGKDAVSNPMRSNPPEKALLTFKEVLEDLLGEMIDTQLKFYKQVNGNPDFAQTLTKFLFDRYRKGM
jgi:hypothetical protein